MFYLIPLIIALLISLVFAKPAMKFLFRAGIKGIDQQKKNKPELPTSSGIIVMGGFLGGVFTFIGLNTFWLKTSANLTLLLAAAFSIIIVTFIGFLDDINVARNPRKDKGIKDIRIGLKQWQKPLLTFPAAIPLMAISAGVSTLVIPVFGFINFSVFFPLIIIPLAVVFVTNSSNMLAGMNGLEIGLGIITSFCIGAYSIFVGSFEAAIISFSTLGALLAIIGFNWYPAKLLPGDSLTYLIGASLVSSVVLADMQKFGLLIFLPWVLEFLLKLRSKFKARSLGVLQPDGTLKSSYRKIYSLTHLCMRLGIKKERNITIAILGTEFVLCLAVFLFYVLIG